MEDNYIMIKKRLFKFTSVFMCAAMMAVSFAACGTNTASVNDTNSVAYEQSKSGDAESTLESIINDQLLGASKSNVSTVSKENSKEETVYVFADASGRQSKLLVNEKLKNATNQKTISDISNLKNISNLNGDETFTASGSKLSWAADGNSITYQGTSDEAAPVTMKVTYYLDGKEISADQLAGKSGKVKIRFDYTNNLKKTITVNGKSKQAYVPFTMITGMMLPNDNFSNVEVTNGKVVEASDSNVVVGITMPGLKDSLNISFDGKKADLDIPEYFEVSADVTDFSLDMTLSVATSNLLTDANLDDINLNDLNSQINTLSDAGNQLADGATTLSDGIAQLQSNVPDLTSGVAQLDDGAGTLQSGLSQYTDGVASAADGVAALDAGANQLSSGINALSDTFKSQILTGVAQLADGADALVGGIQNQLIPGANTLSAGIDKLSATLNGSFSQIKSNADTYGVKYQTALTSAKTLETAATTTLANGATLNDILTQVGQLAGGVDMTIKTATDLSGDLTDESKVTALFTKYITAYTAAVKLDTLSAYNTAIKTQLDTVNGTISQITGGAYKKLDSLYTVELGLLLQAVSNGGVYTALNTVYNTATQTVDPETGYNLSQSLEALSNGAKQLIGGLGQIKDGAGQISLGAKKLKMGIGSFDELNPAAETVCSALYKLQAGGSQLTGGTKQLGDGLSTLKSNNETLNSGASALKAGTSQLRSASATLADGVDQLAEGSITLKDGMIEFNETGVQKLANLVKNDAQDAVDTIKKIVELGNDYQSFAGKSDDVKGTVKFIYKTEGITK